MSRTQLSYTICIYVTHAAVTQGRACLEFMCTQCCMQFMRMQFVLLQRASHFACNVGLKYVINLLLLDVFV